MATQLTAEQLIEIIEEAGYDACAYSGRGMYGKQCVSFSSDENSGPVWANLIGRCDNVNDAAEIMRTMTTDSMGRGAVYYWQRVKWPEEAA